MSEPTESPAPRDQAVHDDDDLVYGLDDDGLNGVYRLDAAEPIGELSDDFGDAPGGLDFDDEVTFHVEPAFTDVPTPQLARPPIVATEPVAPELTPAIKPAEIPGITVPTGFEDIAQMPEPGPFLHPAEPVFLAAAPEPVSPPIPGITMVPIARAGEPAQSPGRPQFAAMIGQLREGFRLGKHRLDGPRHTPDHPAVAETTGLPGNSAIFVSPGDESSSPLEGAVWASVIHPQGQPATATLEADRIMTTMTEPDKGSDYESASIAGQAAEGLDAVAHNDNHTDDTGSAQAPPEITSEMGAVALAHARATTIVPGAKSRSRKRTKAVPAQRPAAEDQPIESVSDAEPVAAHDDSAAISTSWADAGSAESAGSAEAAEAAESAGSAEAAEAAENAEYSEHDEPGDEVIEQPDPVPPRVRGASAAWRKLRSLTAKPKRDQEPDDQELWMPEIEPADAGDTDTDTDSDTVTDTDNDTVTDPATDTDLATDPGTGTDTEAGLPEHWDQSPADASSAPPEEATEWNARTTPHYEPLRFGAGLDEQISFAGDFQPVEAGFGAVALRPAPASVITSEPSDQLALDREALRSLGVPASWAAHLQPGDRFAAIVGILERLPELNIADDVAVIAVVGSADAVELEAHRTALDLPADGRPRAVASVPEAESERSSAIADSKHTRPVVVAVAVDGFDDPAGTRAVLSQINAQSVIAVIDASCSLDEATSWIDSLEGVDAIVLDGALDSARPAELLGLDVPVIRVDGIAVDRINWAALLCAQLAAFDAHRARASA